MKSTHKLALLLVALAAPSQILAAHRPSDFGPAPDPTNGAWSHHGWNPSPTTTTTTTTATTTPENASPTTTAPAAASSAGSSPSSSPSGGSSSSGCDGFAINFSGDLGHEYYVGGSFGDESGNLSDKSSFCFPNGDTGGRVNIGQIASDGSMLSGNSLVECNPVTSGDQPGCDVSYVDGFSVGITCTLANGANFIGAPAPIGCASNILAACPAGQQHPDYNYCANPGFDSDAAVSSPWTDCMGTDSGGAIVWPDGDGYFYFDPALFPVECTIHGEGAVGRRGVGDARGQGHGHGHAEAHVKRGRRSGGLAKGLGDVVGE